MSEATKKQKSFRGKREQAALSDPMDRKLLSLLKDNSRQSYADLGKAIHLSPPAVYERVRRLEKSGVIRGPTVVIDPNEIGLPFLAFIWISTAGEFSCGDIATILAQNPEVEECHSIAGEDNLLIKARTTGPRELELLLGKIRGIAGITKTVSTVVLNTRLERGIQVPPEPDSENTKLYVTRPSRKKAEA